MFLDESHQMIGQLGGMYNGDRSRKTTLVEYGFRLPSRWTTGRSSSRSSSSRMRQAIFVRPRRPTEKRIRRPGGGAGGAAHRPGRPGGGSRPATRWTTCCRRSACAVQRERVLITTLTKRMAEQLTDYLTDNGVKVRYLHRRGHGGAGGDHPRPAPGRLRRAGGHQPAARGLDIPRCRWWRSWTRRQGRLLRAERSLIQTIGRAARNLERQRASCMPTDDDSMKPAMGETERRREQTAGLQRRMASRRAASSSRCAT